MNLRYLAVFVSIALFPSNASAFASGKRWEKLMEAETTAYQQCQLDEAGKYLKAAAKEAMHFNLDDPRLVETLNAGGALFRAEGQFRRSELAYYQALIRGGALLKPDNPVLADSLVGLGIVSQEAHQLEYGRAESFFNQALAIRNKSFGPDSLKVAFTVNCLGELNIVRHKYGRAKAFLQRTLAIRRKKLGPDDPAVPQTLEDLLTIAK